MTQNINPVKREREKLSLTLDQMALAAGVSKSTLLRTEQGLYVDIPPTIMAYLDTVTVHTRGIRSDYIRYQVGQRTANLEQLLHTRVIAREFVSDRWEKVHDNIQYTHPLSFWYKKSEFKSRLDFCKAFCLNPAGIIRFEQGKGHSIPEQLALFLWDYNRNQDLRWLNEEYAIWRNNELKVRYKPVVITKIGA